MARVLRKSLRGALWVALELGLGLSSLKLTPSAVAASLSNVNADGVLLNGYDVVSYFKGREPVLGSAHFAITYKDSVHWFASAENRDLFQKNPEKYEPQYGGWCAYAVADSSSKVEVDPKSFVIQDGRLFVFYLSRGFFGTDTRAKWLKAPQEFVKKADAHWPSIQAVRK